MIATTSKTVRELALEIPNATRVFEKFGIDYCCGGQKSLDDACIASNLSVDAVLEALEKSAEAPSVPKRDWPAGSMGDLIDHIVKTHHKFVRDESARMQPLLAKVCAVHGKNHPELLDIQATFHGLSQELALHLMKEEQVLFPYIVRMEEAVVQKDPILPAPFGTVQHPIRMMTQEHDSAGGALREIRAKSGGYQAPEDACFSYRTLYQALEGFEKDLHEHIHLENNVLFPRAIEMESNLGK